jgi:hypothetical protein
VECRLKSHWKGKNAPPVRKISWLLVCMRWYQITLQQRTNREKRACKFAILSPLAYGALFVCNHIFAFKESVLHIFRRVLHICLIIVSVAYCCCTGCTLPWENTSWKRPEILCPHSRLGEEFCIILEKTANVSNTAARAEHTWTISQLIRVALAEAEEGGVKYL